jgi:hypothetical protein
MLSKMEPTMHYLAQIVNCPVLFATCGYSNQIKLKLLTIATKEKGLLKEGRIKISNAIRPGLLRLPRRAKLDNGEAVISPGLGQRGMRVDQGVFSSDVR